MCPTFIFLIPILTDKKAVFIRFSEMKKAEKGAHAVLILAPLLKLENVCLFCREGNNKNLTTR